MISRDTEIGTLVRTIQTGHFGLYSKDYFSKREGCSRACVLPPGVQGVLVGWECTGSSEDPRPKVYVPAFGLYILATPRYWEVDVPTP